MPETFTDYRPGVFEGFYRDDPLPIEEPNLDVVGFKGVFVDGVFNELFDEFNYEIPFFDGFTKTEFLGFGRF